MKTRQSSVVLMLLLAAATPLASAAPQRRPPAAPAQSPVPAAAPDLVPSQEIDRRADLYYDVTMGHLYAREYVTSNSNDDATRAVDFYKKAYALDPSSQIIGEQLAEIYFLSHRIQDAVKEAGDVLRRDPNNLSIRRLLVRIYIRSLSELRDATEQQGAVAQAVDQLKEIVRRAPRDADSALWLARLERLSNHQDDAEAVLRALLVQLPGNESAVDQLAQMMLEQSKTDEAVALLQNTLQSAPSVPLYDRLGEAYTQKQDAGRAEQAYRHASELDPGQPAHLRGLAQALTDEGKFQEAGVAYEKLIEMEPNDINNYLRLSETYRHLHQLDKAEQQVLAAKSHAPGNLEVIYDEAAVYEAEGRYEDAIRVLSDAVASVKVTSEFAPGRRRTLAILYQLLGQLYRDEQNYGPAINTLEEMARLGPEEDQRARLLMVDTYRSNHDLSHALEVSRKGIADYPDNRALKLSQAFLLGDSKEPDQAAQTLRPLLTNSPADLEIDFGLSQIYTQNRRFSDAEQALRAADKYLLQPTDRETANFLQADVYARQKKYDLADQSFQKALAINPRNASVLNYYGYVLAERGVRLDEAKSLVDRALAEDPDNAAFLDSLGWVYYKQGKLPEAEMTIRKAMSRDDRDPTMHTHLGDVLAKGGRAEQATAEWQKAIAAWQRAVPAEFEADKVTELQQKISGVKNRLAQKTPSDNSGSR